MGKFKSFFKKFTAILSGIVVIVACMSTLFIFADRSSTDKIGTAGTAILSFFILGVFSFVNVILSLVALNLKSFKNPPDKRFARVVFWLNVLVFPCWFFLNAYLASP